jgi:hypothetical protein
MLYRDQQGSRELVWVARQSFEGWGCSACAWVFNPSGWPSGKSLEEMKENFQVQLSAEFAAHACAMPPRVKDPEPPSLARKAASGSK